MAILLTKEDINELNIDSELKGYFQRDLTSICRAQLKKVVGLFRQQESGKLADETCYRISERLLQALLKEVE